MMMPDQSQIPPELAGLLGGAPQGSQMPQDAPDASAPSDPLDLLRDAIQNLQDYLDQEDDDVNSAEGSKVLAGLYKILANEQKNSEQALGVTPAHKAMRRASGY